MTSDPPDTPAPATPTPGRVLGLHVTDRAAVAVVLSSTTGEMVRVPVVTDGVLYLLPDGSSALTRPDEPSPTVDVVDRFADHVGDPAGVVSAHGAVLRAEDLLATVLLLLIDRARPDADIVAVAHPTTWTVEQIAALHDSLAYLSLSGVDLVPVADAPAGTVDDHLAVALTAARTAGGLAPSAVPAVDESTDPTAAPRRRLPLAIGAAVATIAIAAAVAGALVVTSDRTVSTAVPVIADATPATPTSTTAAAPSRSTGPFPTVSPGATASTVEAVSADSAVAATVAEVDPPAPSAPAPAPPVGLPPAPAGPPPGPTVDPAPPDSPVTDPGDTGTGTDPGDTGTGTGTDSGTGTDADTDPEDPDTETPGGESTPGDPPSTPRP